MTPDAPAPEVALVIPCFNEATRWAPARFTQLAALPNVHLLFVDDGSTDGTGALVDALAEDVGGAAIHLAANAGKAEAVRTGFRSLLDEGRFGIVGFIDADGAFGIDDVERLTTMAGVRFGEGYEALWSSRVDLSGRDIDRLASRHYIGRLVATALSLSYPELPYDSQSGFKLFHVSRTLMDCLAEPFHTRWLFEVEILLRWKAATGEPMRIWEEPVMSWRDVPGSKIRGPEVARIARELTRVWRLSLQDRG